MLRENRLDRFRTGIPFGDTFLEVLLGYLFVYSVVNKG